MSIWQNFKDTDHSFEKKFFGAIFFIALAIGLFFMIDKTFDKIPHVKRLFIDNGKYLMAFLIIAIVAYFVTFVIYMKTLDFFEAETNATVKASIISVIVWSIIWLSWSIYCGWLTLTYKPQTISVMLTIWILLLVPSLTAYFVSVNLRKQQIKQENDDKKAMGDDYYKSEPYTICLDKKYYSGYYALICVPVYLITLLIGLLT